MFKVYFLLKLKIYTKSSDYKKIIQLTYFKDIITIFCFEIHLLQEGFSILVVRQKRVN